MNRPFGLQGHRGARGLFPENTLEGFQAAFALGVESFELDVGVTADNVVVVTHDLALNPDITRDAGGNWLVGTGPAVRDLTWDALRQYDVGRIRPGSRYAGLYPCQRACDGARIPALAEVLAALPDARFNIELKTDPRFPTATAGPEAMAEAVMAIVGRAKAAARVTIASFDWRGPRHVRRLRPDIVTVWLTGPETVARADLWWGGPVPADFAGSVARAIVAEGGQHWAPAHETLTEPEVTEARGLGLGVLPWTVNNPDDMQRLIGWGANGLITDRPDLALQLHSPGNRRSWR